MAPKPHHPNTIKPFNTNAGIPENQGKRRDRTILKVEQLHLDPDDWVVISVEHRLSHETAERLRTQIAHTLNAHRAIILDGGLTLKKLTAAERQRLLAEG